jgi:L-amino acid N-acyltransferase YncA
MLEEHGFLRKEVDIDYYKKLINNENCEVYIAKTKNGDIIGFATVFRNKYNVRNFRSTLENLYIDNKEIMALLTKKDKKFAHLDQISIIPDYKRKGVGYGIISKALYDIKSSFIAFIVEKPLANKASALWHEYCGFELVGTADGSYKGQKFEWKIYLNWNNEL